jgi:DNA-binding winged helix-turn-helix (wHTH) protein/Tol biopolymer transport system component
VSARFGPFEVDSDRRLLLKRGVEVHLAPKAFDLLLLLIAEAPRVVRKDELHQRVWPGTFVSDATLVGLIKEVRRALDDHDAKAPIIRTAHGIGYAFAVDVERERETRSGDSRWIVVGSRRVALGEGENIVGGDPVSAVHLDAPGSPHAVAIASIAIVLVLALAGFGLYSRLVRSKGGDPQPTRFSVFPPQSTRFREVAVSPDGRHIAFIAEAPDHSTQLWIRNIDDSQLQHVGVESPGSPFWSPDSQVVGFFTVDKLQKVKLGSQVAELIADVHVPTGFSRAGGSWRRDGLILYGDDTGLHAVRATGGRAVDVLSRSTETQPLWPTFLPDGVHFILTEALQRGIYLGSLRSSSREQIVSAPSRATFIPPNQLVLQSGTALLAQSLDQQTWKPIGTRTTVAEGLGQDWTSNFQYAGTTTTLAYLARPLTELAWVDRQGARQASVTAPGNDMNPVLSADDHKVAFERPRPDSSRSSDIFVLDLGTGIVSQFTSGALSQQPVWFGRSITFASARSGGGIFSKVAGGAWAEKLLLRFPADIHPSNFRLCDRSPDGRSLLQETTTWFDRTGHERGSQGLYIQQLPTGNAIELSGDWPLGCGQFSPDGLSVVYSDLRGIEIASLSSPSKSSTLVYGRGLRMPKWRRDGQEVFYISLVDAKVVAVSVDARTKQAAGSPVALFDTPGVHSRPREQAFAPDLISFAVAKDGQRFIIRRTLNDGGADPATVILNWSPKP